MWNWLRNNRRKKILSAPFPIDWEGHIQHNIPYYQHPNHEKKKSLQDFVQIFIAEKH